MKLRQKPIFSFVAKFLLAFMLVQFYVPNQIFCIESDGRTSIEITLTGSCPTELQKIFTTQETAELNQNCDQAHQDDVGCIDCTDIPLKQEVSLSRFDSEHASLKLLSPSYFYLYAGQFKPHIPRLNKAIEQLSLETFAFVYHPHQILESTILLI